MPNPCRGGRSRRCSRAEVPHPAARVDLHPAARVAAQRHVDPGPGECRRAPRPQRVRLWGARRLRGASRPARPAAATARRRDGPGRSAQPGLSPAAQPRWGHHRVRRRVRATPRGRWWPTVASRRWRPSRRGRSSVRRAGHGRHAATSECRHNGSPHFLAQNNRTETDSAGIRVRSRAGDAVSRAAAAVPSSVSTGPPAGRFTPFFRRDRGSPRAARRLGRGGLDGLFRATLLSTSARAHAAAGAGGAGLGWGPPGARVVGAGRSGRAPGEPCPAASVAAGEAACRDRAAVGPNFLLARLNPGEVAAVLFKESGEERRGVLDVIG